MEKYTKAQMEVIEFENEDVISSSGNCAGGPGYASIPVHKEPWNGDFD